MSASIGSTFHSFAYGLIRALRAGRALRRPAPAALRARAGRRAARAAARTHPESIRWPDSPAARARHPRVRPRGPRGARPARGRRASTGTTCAGWARSTAAGVRGGRRVPRPVPHGPRRPRRRRLRRPDPPRRASRPTTHRDELRARFTPRLRRRVPGHRPRPGALLQAIAGDGRDLVVVGDPHQSIYAFRGAEVRGILDFPTEFPQADGAPADVVALRTTRRFGPRLLDRRASGSPPGSPLPGCDRRPRPRQAFLAPEADGGAARRRPGRGAAPSTPTGPRPSTSPTCSAGRTSRTASRGPRWPCWSAPGRQSIPALRRRWRRPACRSRWPRRDCRWSASPACAPLLDALRVVLNLDNDDPDHADHIDAGAGRGAADLPARPASTPATSARLARQLRAAREGARRTPSERHAAPARPSCSARGRARPGARSTALDGDRGPAAARAVGALGAARTARAQLDAGAHRRGGALGAVVRHRLARAGCGHRSSAAAAAARRAHRDLDAVVRAVRRRPRGPRSTAATPASRRSWPPWSPSRSRPTRWPSGASAARPCACSPPTAPRASSGGWSSSRTSRRTAGPTCAAARRCSRADRIGADGLVPPDRRRASCSPRSAGCSTSRAPAPASGSSSPRSARRTTTASSPRGSSPSSASTVERTSTGRPAAAAVARRPGRRAAAHRAPTRRARAAARGRCAAGSPGWPRRRAGGRPLVPVGRPRVVVGDPRPRAAPSQPLRDPDDAGAGCPPARWTRSRPARRSGSSTREAGGVARAPPVAGLRRRSCTRSPTRVAKDELGAGPDAAVDELMAHVDAVWDQLRVPHPVVARRASASEVRGGAGPVPRTGTSDPTRARWSATEEQFARRASTCPTASRSGCTATPTGSSSTPTAGSWSSTSRPASTKPTDKSGREQPPARPLPARRRPRRRRRRRPGARRAEAAAPSSCSCRNDGPRRAQGPAPDPQADDGTACADRAPADATAAQRCAARSSRRSPASTADDCDFVPICPAQERRAGGVVTDRARARSTPRRPARG